MQDAGNWVELVNAWPGKKSREIALLAFCRRWEDASAGKVVSPLLDMIDPVLWVEFREELEQSVPRPEWAWAIQSDGVLPAEIPLSAALRMLDVYCLCWLADGSCDRWSDQEFRNRFPWLFLALVIVAEADADAAVLQTIALLGAQRCPAFDGLDLWLQRRAACACLRQQGTAFLVEHFENLRLETLASALVSRAYSSRDLMVLQSLLAEHGHWEANLTVEELLGATEQALLGGVLVN